jgi:putative addiction module killer protein
LKLNVYETVEGRAPFVDWFDGLDGTFRRAVQRRLRAIEDSDHLGHRKSLRGGLFELKFRQPIRIYYAETGGRVMLLFGGSGKGDQNCEIAKARRRLNDFMQRTR